MRWDDIVSRVFGRIDPIATGGEDYRRAQPNVEVYDTPHPLRRDTGRRRYLLRTDDGDEFTSDKVSSRRGHERRSRRPS